MAPTSKEVEEEPVREPTWTPQFTDVLTYAARRLKQDVVPARKNMEEKEVNTVCSIGTKDWLFRDSQNAYSLEERANAVTCELIQRVMKEFPLIEEKRS
uniref:Uncharacterized protein n=1 Tax=Plectus sambesii TaxID=2011161 RepID=A0A914XG57_9BILA